MEMDVNCYHPDANASSQPCDVTGRDVSNIFIIELSLGLLGLGGALSVFVHAIYKRVYFTSEIRPLFHISMANTGFSSCVIVLAALHLWWIECLYETSLIIATLEEIFFLIIFCLMTNYVIVVYVRLNNKVNLLDQQRQLQAPEDMRRRLKFVYLFSWVVPPLLLIPVTATVVAVPVDVHLCIICPDVTYYPQTEETAFDNWFLQNYGRLLVILIFITTSITTSVYYYRCRKICSILLKQDDISASQTETMKWVRERLSLYVLIFFLCWTITFVISILGLVVSLMGSDPLACSFLFYIGAVLPSIYGFLLACIYFYGAYYQTRQWRASRKHRTPFAKTSFRYYGTGEQRSRYPKNRVPSPSVSESNNPFNFDPSVHDAASSAQSSPSPLPKTKPRSPSFLPLLKDSKTSGKDSG